MYAGSGVAHERALMAYNDSERRRLISIEGRVVALETHAAEHVHDGVMIGGSYTAVATMPEE